MEEEQPQILTFVSITDAEPETARRYLEAWDWNLDQAVSEFFDANRVSGGASPRVATVNPHPLADLQHGDVLDDEEGGDAVEVTPVQSGDVDSIDSYHTPTNSPQGENAGPAFQPDSRRALPADFPEGFGERDLQEAQMLEAVFQGVPFAGDYEALLPELHRPPPRPPSPATLAARELREQQDVEFEESQRRDREKREAAQEAERQQREAVVLAERQKEEAANALSRVLDVKRAALPEEPAENEADAVVVMFRLPDGKRRRRRFSKSHPVTVLFDYIDVEANAEESDMGTGHWWKLDGYHFVTQFPRRVFQATPGLTLSAAGLIHKQETLFVELK